MIQLINIVKKVCFSWKLKKRQKKALSESSGHDLNCNIFNT